MNKTIQIAIIVVGLGAGGLLLYGQFTKPQPGENLDFDHYFLCADEKCGEQFAIGPDEWKEKYKLEAELDVPCPNCGAGFAIKAAKCPECGQLHHTIGHGQSQPSCPHCGADLTRKWDDR